MQLCFSGFGVSINIVLGQVDLAFGPVDPLALLWPSEAFTHPLASPLAPSLACHCRLPSHRNSIFLVVTSAIIPALMPSTLRNIILRRSSSLPYWLGTRSSPSRGHRRTFRPRHALSSSDRDPRRPKARQRSIDHDLADRLSASLLPHLPNSLPVTLVVAFRRGRRRAHLLAQPRALRTRQGVTGSPRNFFCTRRVA